MRSKLRFWSFATAAAVVSILSSTTISQAVLTPKMNLGLLKEQQKWRVGTVSTKEASYCAMVGRFEKEVVLAFARNADGNSSLAIDFRENFFEPGEEYELTLKTGHARAVKLTARASSVRSVVAQMGAHDDMLEAIGRSGVFSVGLPTIDVSFAVKRFGPNLGLLTECSSGIGVNAPPAVSVLPVDQQGLTGDTAQAGALVTASVAAAQEPAAGGGDLATAGETELARLQDIARKYEELQHEHAELQKKFSAQEAELASLRASNAGLEETTGALSSQALEMQSDYEKKIAALEEDRSLLRQQIEREFSPANGERPSLMTCTTFRPRAGGEMVGISGSLAMDHAQQVAAIRW